MKKLIMLLTLILFSINVFSQEKRVHFMNYPLEGKTSDFIDYLSSKNIKADRFENYKGKLLDRKVTISMGLKSEYVDLIKLTIYTNDYKYDAEVITNYFTEKYGNPTTKDHIEGKSSRYPYRYMNFMVYKWNLENGYIEITHDNIATAHVNVEYFNRESAKINKKLEQEQREQYIKENRIVVE